jgi:SPP1 gp7 family putative phage head morphogenesis protein
MADIKRLPFAKNSAPEEKPLEKITSIERSDLFTNGNFQRYNPDQLAAKKGGITIYQRMLDDEQVKAVVDFKIASIIGRGWSFEFPTDVGLAADERKTRSAVMQACTDEMEGAFVDALRAVLRGTIFGFSLCEKVLGQFEHDGKTYIGISKILPRDVKSFYFYTDPYGTLQRFTQRNAGKEIELDYEKFIHYVRNPEEDPYYGASELKPAYRAWFLKDTLLKFEAQHLERFAGGFAMIELGESGVTPGSPDYIALQSIVSNMRSSMGVILPQGVKMTVQMPTSTEAFRTAIEYHDLAIAKALLIPNLLGLSHTGKTGSFAQSQTQLESYLMTIAADTQRLEQVLNDQLFGEIGERNWSDGIIPQFRFKQASEDQMRWVVTTWMTLVSGSTVVPTEEDEAYLRKLMGMPNRNPEDKALVTPAQQHQQQMDKAALQKPNIGTQTTPGENSTGQKFARDVADAVELALHRFGFNPDEARDGHGMWTDSGGEAATMLQSIKSTGGVSYNPMTQSSPTSGYAVSMYPEHTRVLDHAPTPADLAQYLSDKAAQFKSLPGAHLGVWYDHSTGQTYLDVSHVEADHNKAVALGVKYNQKAIWDFKNGREIGTGGTGKVPDGTGGAYTATRQRKPAGFAGRMRSDRGDAESGRARFDGRPAAGRLEFYNPATGRVEFYDDSQPRDGSGKWTDSGGPAGGAGPDAGASGRAGTVPNGLLPEHGVKGLPHGQSVIGVHYSGHVRQLLDPTKYGTGMKDAAATRIAQSGDPRLANRVHFYQDIGNGISKEAGVGAIPHQVQLHGIYPMETDPLNLNKRASPNPAVNASAYESAILDAGYSGYSAPFGRQRAVVLLGKDPVPVKHTFSRLKFYSPDQPRASDGKWTVGSGLSDQPIDPKVIPRSNSMDPTGGKNGLLNPSQVAIETAMANHIASNPRAAANAYARLKDTMGGKVMSVDIARELSPHYLADRTQSSAVQEPGSWLVKQMYAEKLAQPAGKGQLPTVLFTAGGMGAGKTTGLDDTMPMAQKQAQIIYDSNLSNPASAISKINQALQAGKLVSLAYVDRHPADAFMNGAVKRAVNQEEKHGTGRTVSIDTFLKTHYDARASIDKIYAHFKDNPRVSIKFVENRYGKGGAQLVTHDQMKPLDQSTYSSMRGQIANELKAAYKSGKVVGTASNKSNGGRISEAVFKGFTSASRLAHSAARHAHAEDGAGDVCVHQHGSEERSLKFTHALSRVAFSVIAQKTMSLEADVAQQAARLCARMCRRVLDQPRLKELLTVNAGEIGNLTMDSTDIGKIKAAFKSGLERGWTIGATQAMDETQRLRPKMSSDERKLRFADLRNNAADYLESNAFRMAGNLADSSRAIIQQELLKAVRNGDRPEDAAASIYERLINKGMTTLDAVDLEEPDQTVRDNVSNLLSDALDTANVPAYLNTLARTNIFEALNEARYAEFTDPKLSDFVEGLEYSAIIDDRTTDICREMDGKQYLADNPIWDDYRPPLHYNCRSLLVAITSLDGWDGVESDPPTVEPQDGF